jgi:hypothetical protein
MRRFTASLSIFSLIGFQLLRRILNRFPTKLRLFHTVFGEKSFAVLMFRMFDKKLRISFIVGVFHTVFIETKLNTAVGSEHPRRFIVPFLFASVVYPKILFESSFLVAENFSV